MIDQLTKDEKAKYEAMWNIPSYRNISPGYLFTTSFFDVFKDQIMPGDSITDFGCGTGFATLPFLEKDLTVHLVDIAPNALSDKIAALTLLKPDKVQFTEACLWDLPNEISPSDWIYCMDVLEHIPPKKIDAVLAQMASRTKKGGALQVFLKNEPFGDLIGETLHLTIKPLPWWIKKINTYFKIEKINTLVYNIRYTLFVTPLT